MAKRLNRWICGLGPTALLLAVLPTVAAAQTDTATPGPRYGAGSLHRWLFGSAYRDLWTTPVRLPVLNLDSAGGGLSPSGTGGGQQTLGLRFVGADGRPYTFRSLDKDPTEVLPPGLRETFAAELVQDQISSAFPTAPPVVDVLLEAVGVIPRHTTLVVLPDDPALGEHQARFAHRIGTFEEWANDGPGGTAGFAGATEVLSSEELLAHLQADPREHVDLTTFLAARLIDVFVGDWDRHQGQWRWGNIGSGTPPGWVPFPEDRDQAFAKYDGLLLGIARYHVPQLTNFGPEYPAILGATWNGRDLDRRLLVRVERDVWDSVTAAVTAALTDEVIDRAVARLPEAHERLRGDYLRHALRRRRDDLPEMSRRYFRLLASEVDLHLTDAPDAAVFERSDRGELMVSVSSSQRPPYLVRHFAPGDTREIRLHLEGGADSVLVRGRGPGSIRIRVISGEGQNVVQDDADHGATVVYDERPDGATVGNGVRLVHQPDPAPAPPPGELPPRDWGTRSFPLFYLSVESDLGLVLHGGYVHERFGFRKHPHAQYHRVTADFSSGRLDGRVQYHGEIQRESSADRFAIDATASGIEVTEFFGFGNDAIRTDDLAFYKVYQNELRLRAAYEPALAPHARLTFGIEGRYTSTNDDRATLITQLRPYGFENVGRIAAVVGVEVDTRDGQVTASHGVHLRTYGIAVPGIFGVDSGAYGRVEGSLSGFLTPARPLTLGVRVGGARVWGNYPFMDAAFLGGGDHFMGYHEQRYAGDASAYLNSYLRLGLGHVFLAVPSDFGIVGLFNAGRVWYQSASPDGWHTGIGGGLYLAPLRQVQNSVLLAVVRGEDTLFYLRLGFGF